MEMDVMASVFSAAKLSSKIQIFDNWRTWEEGLFLVVDAVHDDVVAGHVDQIGIVYQEEGLFDVFAYTKYVSSWC